MPCIAEAGRPAGVTRPSFDRHPPGAAGAPLRKDIVMERRPPFNWPFPWTALASPMNAGGISSSSMMMAPENASSPRARATTVAHPVTRRVNNYWSE